MIQTLRPSNYRPPDLSTFDCGVCLLDIKILKKTMKNKVEGYQYSAQLRSLKSIKHASLKLKLSKKWRLDWRTSVHMLGIRREQKCASQFDLTQSSPLQHPSRVTGNDLASLYAGDQVLTFNLLLSLTFTLHMNMNISRKSTLSVTVIKMALSRGYEGNDVPLIITSLSSCSD